MKHILAALVLLFSFNAMADEIKYKIPEGVTSPDVHVLEFTPKARPDYICVYAEGGNDGGLSCFPKKDPVVKQSRALKCTKEFKDINCEVIR